MWYYMMLLGIVYCFSDYMPSQCHTLRLLSNDPLDESLALGAQNRFRRVQMCEGSPRVTLIAQASRICCGDLLLDQGEDLPLDREKDIPLDHSWISAIGP